METTQIGLSIKPGCIQRLQHAARHENLAISIRPDQGNGQEDSCGDH